MTEPSQSQSQSPSPAPPLLRVHVDIADRLEHFIKLKKIPNIIFQNISVNVDFHVKNHIIFKLINQNVYLNLIIILIF